uniref:E3 ubiquitin-protein ligase HACE1 n=1 Tax=Amorphochlora amoebiformis TaxID=1561963 RepID=A0A7S0DRK3_9EUKA
MQEMLNSKTVKMKGRRVQRPIFTAAEFGSVKVILQLICNGESPSTPGHGGRSPIMCAIQHDQPAAFKVLVEAGGRWGPPTSLNPDPAPPADQKGWTPLHYAAAYSAIKCLDLMLSGAVSANMDIKDNFMKEALNAADESGQTPLHLAASCGFIAGIRRLIQAGAMATYDIKGKLALQCALEFMEKCGGWGRGRRHRNKGKSEELERATESVVVLSKHFGHLVSVFSIVQAKDIRDRVIKAIGWEASLRMVLSYIDVARNLDQLNPILTAIARCLRSTTLTTENFPPELLRQVLTVLVADGHVDALECWAKLLRRPTNRNYTTRSVMRELAAALRSSSRITLCCHESNVSYSERFFNVFLTTILNLYVANRKLHLKPNARTDGRRNGRRRGRLSGSRSRESKRSPTVDQKIFFGDGKEDEGKPQGKPEEKSREEPLELPSSLPSADRKGSESEPKPTPKRTPKPKTDGKSSGNISESKTKFAEESKILPPLLDENEISHSLDSAWMLLDMAVRDIDEYIEDTSRYAVVINGYWKWCQVFPHLGPVNKLSHATESLSIHGDIKTIRTADSSSEAAQAVESIDIIIPSHGAPGKPLLFTLPNGFPYAVQIPTDSGPGDKIKVPVPRAIMFGVCRMPSSCTGGIGNSDRIERGEVGVPEGKFEGKAVTVKEEELKEKKQKESKVVPGAQSCLMDLTRPMDLNRLLREPVSDSFKWFAKRHRKPILHLIAESEGIVHRYFTFLTRLWEPIDTDPNNFMKETLADGKSPYLLAKVQFICAAITQRSHGFNELVITVNRMTPPPSPSSSRRGNNEKNRQTRRRGENVDQKNGESKLRVDKHNDKNRRGRSRQQDSKRGAWGGDPGNPRRRRWVRKNTTTAETQPSSSVATTLVSEVVQNGPPSIMTHNHTQEHRERTREWIMQQMLSAPPNTLNNGLSVRYEGEDGVGEGPLRELLAMITGDMFAPDSKFFCPAPNSTHLTIHKGAPKVHQVKQYMRMVGRLLALAVTQRQPFGVPLCSGVLKALLGRNHEIGWQDLQTYDEDLYRGMKTIADAKTKEEFQLIADGLMFVVSTKAANGEVKDVALLKNGADRPVTFEDRDLFTRLYARFRMFHGLNKELSSLSKGFQDILPVELSKYLNPSELSSLIQGPERLDIADMKANILYDGGYHSTSSVICWFWKMVEEMTFEEQQRLLLFWSGCPIPPLHGFSAKFNNNGEAWSIKKLEAPPTSLPTASTCIYLLRLPPYPSERILRERLAVALKFGTEGYDTE